MSTACGPMWMHGGSKTRLFVDIINVWPLRGMKSSSLPFNPGKRWCCMLNAPSCRKTKTHPGISRICMAVASGQEDCRDSIALTPGLINGFPCCQVSKRRLAFNMYKFSTFVSNKVVQWDKLGEMENEYTSYNFGYSVIYLSKIIKIDGHLTKFWHKQFVQVFLTHGVYT